MMGFFVNQPPAASARRRVSRLAGLMLLAALGATPASAQFNDLFPPRPAVNVPGNTPQRAAPPQNAPLPPRPPRPDGGIVRGGELAPPPGSTPGLNAAPPSRAGEPLQLGNTPPASPAQRQPRPKQPPANGEMLPANGAAPAASPVGATDELVIPPPEVKIANKSAVFSGLDKITGRITSFDVAINETVQFGALRVTPRACYTRPATENQNTTAFIEVDEITLKGEIRRLFTGWQYAASPGLHAVEHAIYDIWLTDCKQAEPSLANSAPPKK